MSSFGHKTRSPGYIPGDHWVECSVCGFVIRSSSARKDWEGSIVCPEDFELRHPQDFVRGRPEDTSAKGLVRNESDEVSVSPFDNDGAIAGVAIAGEAVAGGQTETIPSGTFDNSL